MPATKESIAKDVIEKKFKELTSMVIDLEDAVGDNHVQEAEDQLLKHLQTIYLALETQTTDNIEDLPLIFIRVRDPEQMRRLTLKIRTFSTSFNRVMFSRNFRMKMEKNI